MVEEAAFAWACYRIDPETSTPEAVKYKHVGIVGTPEDAARFLAGDDTVKLRAIFP